MQLRLSAAAAIYFASYLPLSVILLVQDLEMDRIGGALCNLLGRSHPSDCQVPLGHPIFALLAVAGCAVALLIARFTLAKTFANQRVTIKEAKHVPADLMNYTLPYVVSLIGLDYKDPGKLLGFLVFFFWMFVITYRSGQTIMNPVLTVFGWRLYEVTYTYLGGSNTERRGVALSLVQLEAGHDYTQGTLQDVLIVRSI